MSNTKRFLNLEHYENVQDRTILITGGYGFAASYLIRYLLTAGAQRIHILVRRNSDPYRHKKLGIYGNKYVTVHYGDLLDQKSIHTTICTVKPEIIYNLGAVMYVQDSWVFPKVTLETNALAVLHILNSMVVLRDFTKIECRLVQAGSSEEYGEVHSKEVPITEENPLRPKSPYGASKVAADHFCRIYSKYYTLDVIVTRAFNHAGKLQNPRLVIPSFAREVVLAFLTGSPINHGNLDSVRDFTHVEDVVRAYATLGLTRPNEVNLAEVYNICSGTENSVPMETLLRYFVGRMKDSPDNKGHDINYVGTYVRPNDVKLLVGSYEKIYRKYRWSPELSIYDVLDEALEEALEEVKKNE